MLVTNRLLWLREAQDLATIQATVLQSVCSSLAEVNHSLDQKPRPEAPPAGSLTDFYLWYKAATNPGLW